MSAPFGRRACEVLESRPSGGYRVISLLDRDGPEPRPGQFYMLAAARHWEQRSQRPYLPRALSVADAAPRGEGLRLDFLLEAVGPGTERLCELEVGEEVWVNGPLGNRFSPPAQGAAGAILVGGGIGIAPLAILRRSLANQGVPTRILLGFRDRLHSGGLDDLFSCHEIALASEDGHTGHHGYVTDLLATMLLGDDATSAVVYACGPPAMLDSVTAICGEHSVPCQLAMEAPMACGFGACFGCAVPNPAGDGYIRLCVDGPVIRAGAWRESVVATATPAGGAVGRPAPEEASATAGGGGPRAATGPAGRGGVGFCGLELKHPVINASGTFDAIAARKVYGDELLRDFPFAAFVSKTITREPRAGNEPQRIWETPAGMINSIGLPNKGLERFLAEDLPTLAELPVPLIVSIMATSREEFTELIRGVGERHEVAAIELNVSCPNVHSGLIVGESPSETVALLEAVRPLTPKPLIVKLTPNVANPAEVAVAAEEGGADAVSLVNTLKAGAIDPSSGEPAIAAGHGGLSGPAIRPVAIAQIRSVAAAVRLPIVGMGGVGDGADALEMIDAGASLVAVGTESFRDPRAGERIASELQNQLSGRPGPQPRVEVQVNLPEKP
ncbi:MAG TPA: dihydroorotate dehydrogenase [Solirubrobacterales bacterium]